MLMNGVNILRHDPEPRPTHVRAVLKPFGTITLRVNNITRQLWWTPWDFFY